METNLILEGFKFMGLGMGTVLLFLVVLIFLMNAMSKIVNKYFPEPQASLDPVVESKSDNKKIIAAITAAISHHRQG
ncbi:OadG family transporter subunit [Sulfurimonas sp.]|uniref:OadG family transporter subunit n=1 Tax=Sulfurimonas sp. TaxID=2022749 RepID=UPI002AAF816F|nr:OadG family transporter subunit [Sulfurimonas sp.]